MAFLLVAGLFPVAVIGGIVFHFVERELELHRARLMSVRAEEIRNAVEQDVLATFVSLRGLAADPVLFGTPHLALRQYGEHPRTGLEGTSGQSPECIAVVDESGDLLARRGECWDYPRRKVRLAKLIGMRPAVSDVFFLRAGKPALDFWIPLRSESSALRSRGGLFATVSLDYLSDFLNRRSISEGVTFDGFIFTTDGTMLARRVEAEGLISNMAPVYPALFDALSNPDGHVIGIAAASDQSIAATSSLVGLLPELRGLAKWRVGLIQPLDDPGEPSLVLIRRLRYGMVLTVVLTIATSLLFSAILLRSILIPVGALITATVRVRQGDLRGNLVVDGVWEFAQLGAFFNEMREQLSLSLQQLTELATTDQLTGLANRRSLDVRLREEIKRVRRYSEGLSLAILDVDFFKRVNDRYGHTFGDQVLREIAAMCRQVCRETDLVARFGGEEFVFVLARTTKDQAAGVMERVRTTIGAATIAHPASVEPIRVTVSVGVASVPDDSLDQDGLLRKADDALYRAKASGRNCTILA